MEDDIVISNLKSYLSGLNSTRKSIKSVQELYDPMLAFKFNLFNFWNPQENKISEILSFFLDPNESHGQGDAFLQIFIDKLNLDAFNSNTKSVHVKCEYPCDGQRRI